MNRQTEYDLLTRIAKHARKGGIDDAFMGSEDIGIRYTRLIWEFTATENRVTEHADDDDFINFAFRLMRHIEEAGRAYFYRRGKMAKGTSNWWADLGMRTLNAAGCFGTEHLAMLDCIAKTLEALPEVTP